MGLMLTRLVFLAFIGLTGFITYNALYLQELRNQTVVPKVIRGSAPPVVAQTGVVAGAAEPAKLRAVTTDLPPLQGQEAHDRTLVTAIQRELAARGYGSGPADGRLGEETRKAITAFQKDNGLPETGEPTDELLRYILLGAAVPAGPSTGSVASLEVKQAPAEAKALPNIDPTVKQVQQTLADLGYAPGPADGAMGRETERAIAAFQRDRKLDANGRITSELLEEIRSVTGRDLESGAPRP
jgi:peptidoglycan hydrolase-like protein with peptidoglycan-binding domain